MININCEGCPNHCCGRNPHLTPVLLPSEEQKFNEHSISVRTPYREMRLLAKKPDGNCIFLDDKTRCTIYDQRPFECKLYPFLLDFEFGIAAKLDKRFCLGLESLQFDKSLISDLLRQYRSEFSEDWVKAYLSMEDY
jgi:Fe-S-cluster containining protein